MMKLVTAHRDTLTKSGSTESPAPASGMEKSFQRNSLGSDVQQSAVHVRNVWEFRMDTEYSKRRDSRPTWLEKRAGVG